MGTTNLNQTPTIYTKASTSTPFNEDGTNYHIRINGSDGSTNSIYQYTPDSVRSQTNQDIAIADVDKDGFAEMFFYYRKPVVHFK